MAKTILVVHEQAETRSFLTTVLQHVGYRVLAAATGAEALEILEREKVHLVLLDLLMPGHAGTTLYRQMIRSPELRSTPVIDLRALPPPQARAPKALPAPVDRDELLLAVKRALA